MVYRKGERTTKHWEAEHPYAVDIPNRGTGLGQTLNEILDAIRPLGGRQWGYRDWAKDRWALESWIRLGFKDNRDAARMVWQFRHLGAVRAR